ncbi:MAG: hypothetical protein HGA45_38535 [Chloroflexales bacterium]|nr:hypothetical protein [Chloroflexales bacterium]
MFQPNNQVVIEVPGQPDAWVFGKVLRVEGDRLVASDGRTYPAEGGEDTGNVHPRHTLHPADHETSAKVVSTLLRQRVLGLVAEAAAHCQYIAAWHITDRIGLVVDSGMLTRDSPSTG